jgi:DNA polymerase (family 10)
VEEIIKELKKYTEKIEPAGSLRRMKETIGDIDILASGRNNIEIIEKFTTLPMIKEILAKGDTKASVIVKTNNLQVDLRVVDNSCFGAALQYFTGSKAHNIKLRTLAKEKGLKISEYGIFKGERKIAGKTEEEIYKTLGLVWIPPELREDRGEIEAALENKLPILVKEEDIKGDLHVHSKYSDGVETIEEIAIAGKNLGYEYIGISDHSKTSKIAGGLDEESLKKRNEEIDRINAKIKGIRILKGMEVDILGDGSLDYSDKILEELDFVIAAIHQGFKKNVTERIKKAIENPYVDIIAHPTGRLLSGREGYEIDIEEVIEYASKFNVVLEINCYPDRLDLNDIHILKAKKKNIKFSLGTDSHNIGMLKYIRFGIGIAKRGWLTKEEILNTYKWEEMPLRRRKK